MYYTSQLNSCKNTKVREKKYKVVICAIFKNEAAYLKEWIEFHKIVGVEHFYLYNNNSEDNFREVLAPYIKAGIVDLIEWPHQQAQMAAYRDCVNNYGKLSQWVGFIDIDEFIVPKKEHTIYDFLKQFDKTRGTVIIYWRLFGTSGKLDRDRSGLITEDMVCCWDKYDTVGKCFYNCDYEFIPDFPQNATLHHYMWTKKGNKLLPPVNLYNKVCINGENPVPNDDFPIQVNHYFTKTYEEYLEKCGKGDVYFKVNPHTEEYFYKHEMNCTSVDYSAYKYMIKLKLNME